MTLRATSATGQGATDTRFDVHVVIGVSGSVTVYANGSSIVTWSGDTTDGGSYGNITSVVFRRHNLSFPFGNLLATDDDSRDYEVIQLTTQANGGLTDFTGSESDIDDTTPSFADSITSTTAGDQSTFTLEDIPAGFSSGYTVEGVHVSAMTRNATGDARARAIVRSSGVVGQGDIKSLQPVVATVNHFFTTDPNTSTAWTVSGVNAMEAGVESVAPA